MAVRKLEPKADHTVVAAGVQVKGNLVTHSDLWFDGIISGNIEAKGSVTLGPQAAVEGNITCQNLVVAGQVQGNLSVKDSLSLAEDAIVRGDIQTGLIEIARGAKLSGHLRMDHRPQQPSGQES